MFSSVASSSEFEYINIFLDYQNLSETVVGVYFVRMTAKMKLTNLLRAVMHIKKMSLALALLGDMRVTLSIQLQIYLYLQKLVLPRLRHFLIDPW